MLVLAKIGIYVFPILLIGVPLYAWYKGIPVYDTFAKGAEEGFRTVLGTLPFLVAIFVAISCFRGSGALEITAGVVGKFLKPLGIPADMLPLLIVRPISGSGALALTGDLLRNYGPDNPMGLLASILQGATDTTFFVITLYFGSVGIKKFRHAIASCLIGDIFGFLTGFFLWSKFMH